MAADHRRRSLLTGTPRPQVRGVRPPNAPELAEPTEIPDEAVQLVEEPGGVPVTPPLHAQIAAPNATEATPTTTTERQAPRAERRPAPQPQPNPMRLVPATFMASMAVTLMGVVVPWFAVLSPLLHAALDARDEPSEPVIVEVPVPFVVTPPAPAEPEPMPTAVEPTPRAPAPVAPRATRSAPDPAPAPAPAPAPPEVAPPPPPPPEPVAESPPAARDLDGRYAGTVGGKPLILALTFGPSGRLTATITRATEDPVEAVGRYTLSGDRATLAFVEPVEGGASYSGTASPDGLSGRIAYPSGKTQRFSVSR